MVEELMRDFAVGGAVLGQLSALYFYGYAGMQIPVGVLLDRFGPRRLMTGAAALCAIGSVVFASSGLAGASAARLVIGIGCAFSLVGAMAVAGQWFPARRFALLSGLAMMMWMAGGAFGQAPVGLLVDAIGWRRAVLVTASGGVLLAVAAWALVRDHARTPAARASMLTGLRAVCANREIWLSAVAGLGATGPLLAFAALWGVPYFESAYGLSRAEAATLTSMTFIGWGAGAPLFGWLSDRIGLRRPPLIAGLTISSAALAVILYAPGLGVAALGPLCFLLGFGGSGQIVNFALAREHTPLAFSSTAIGVVNALVTGAGALYQPAVGWILDQRWNAQTVAGAPVYTASDYEVAFSIVLAGCGLGLVCSLALTETRCRALHG
jgi:MFS family permease